MDTLCRDIGCSSPTSNQKECCRQTIKRCTLLLEHACHCCDANCPLPGCRKMKRVVRHTSCCKRNIKCNICIQLIALCCHHAEHCKETMCPVPYCASIKQQLREGIQQRHLPNLVLQLKAYILNSNPRIRATNMNHMQGIVCGNTDFGMSGGSIPGDVLGGSMQGGFLGPIPGEMAPDGMSSSGTAPGGSIPGDVLGGSMQGGFPGPIPGEMAPDGMSSSGTVPGGRFPTCKSSGGVCLPDLSCHQKFEMTSNEKRPAKRKREVLESSVFTSKKPLIAVSITADTFGIEVEAPWWWNIDTIINVL